MLKTLEGAMKTIVAALLAVFGANPDYKAARRRADAGAAAALPTLTPTRYGGAMLLGVDGVCIICHGSSTPGRLSTRISVAREMVERDVVTSCRAAIAGLNADDPNVRP